MTTTASHSAMSVPTRPNLVAEKVLIHRSLIRSIRDAESLLMAILLPVALMLVFTLVFGGAITAAGDYVDYVVPGIILTCAGFGASTTATFVANDMQRGIINRLRTMPIRANAVLTGHVIASVARNLVATTVVIAVALIIGFKPQWSLVAWLGVLGLITLYILAITYLFAAIGLAAGSAEAASGYGFVLLFLPYLSSAFVPIETMPAWIQPIALHQPITPIIETIRSLLLGASEPVPAMTAVIWCVAILAGAMTWGAWLFRRKAPGRS